MSDERPGPGRHVPDPQTTLLVSVVRPEARPPVVVVTGQLDAANVAIVTQRLTELMGGGTDIVVDLGRVDFIDLVSARALADLASELTARGRALTLRAAPPAVERLFRLSGLDRAFGPGAGPT